MKAQEIFDKIVTHLLTQKERASVAGTENPKPICKYRLRVGCKTLSCAIGALIPNEVYREEFEGQTVLGLLGMVQTRQINQEKFDLLKEYIWPEDMNIEDGQNFLRTMQWIHDTSDPETWYATLRMHAMVNGLNFNPPPS